MRDALAVLMQRNPDALLLRRGDVIQMANDALARMLGYPNGAALAGVSVLQLVAPEERGTVAWQMSGADAGLDAAPALLKLRRLDGTLMSVELRQGSAAHLDGAAACIVSVREAGEHQADLELAREMERLEDRVVAARELLDRCIVGAANDASSPLTRSRLQELSARLGELQQEAARIKSRAR